MTKEEKTRNEKADWVARMLREEQAGNRASRIKRISRFARKL